MPEQYISEIRGSSLSKGDVVIMGEDIGTHEVVKTAPLVTLERKQKYVHVVDADGTPGKFGMDNMLKVERTRMTKEEAAARLRAETVRMLVNGLRMAEGEYKAATEDYVGKLQSKFYTDHWDVERFLSAQALVKIWRELAEIVKFRIEDDKFKGDTVEAVVRDAAQALVSRMIHDHLRDYRGVSRSTSVVSNTVDDIESSVKMHFIDGLRWKTDIELTPKRDW